jgi:hypothetical protein
MTTATLNGVDLYFETTGTGNPPDARPRLLG